MLFDSQDVDDYGLPIFTCAVCGCILDSRDDSTYVCNDIRCQRTWEYRVDAAEDKRIERLKRQEEY